MHRDDVDDVVRLDTVTDPMIFDQRMTRFRCHPLLFSLANSRTVIGDCIDAEADPKIIK